MREAIAATLVTSSNDTSRLNAIEESRLAVGANLKTPGLELCASLC